MNLLDTATLFGILIVLAAMPSASVALVVTRAATMGLANGVAVAIGIVVGDLVFIAFAILGLSVVAEQLGGFFFAVKILGGLYLIWLGLRLLRSSDSALVLTSPVKTEVRGLIASFCAGFFLTLGDVKAILFYVSLFPMFINLQSLQVRDLIIVSVVTIFSVGLIKVVYAVLAIKIVNHSRNQNLSWPLNKLAGGLMMGAGSYLVLKS